MKRRFSAAFLLGMIFGLGGEALLLSKAAVSRFSGNQRENFHVLFFMPQNSPTQTLSKAQQSIMEIPGTYSATLISQEKALSILKKEDPELAQNLSFLPANPLEPAVEATLSRRGLLSFSSWMSEASSKEKWTDTRYQPEDIKSILRLELYSRFLNVSLTALLCLASLVVILGILLPLMTLSKHSPHKMMELLSLSVKTMGIAGIGIGLGGFFSVSFASPLARSVSWWAWPSLAAQGIFLVSAAAACAILCVW